MSYSVSVSGVEGSSDKLAAAMIDKFRESYPNAGESLSEAAIAAADEIRYLGAAVNDDNLADDHTWSATISGHVKAGPDDGAPNFVSVTVQQNPNPPKDDEPVEDEDSVVTPAEPVTA